MTDEETPYGFRWGPAEVSRCMEHRGIKVMTVDTPDHHVEISVSPTGRSVRLWLDGKEVR